MNKQSIKLTMAGFIGGVAFIIGCGGGGGSATNSAIANGSGQIQDIEEMYCGISSDGVSNPTAISSSLNSFYHNTFSLGSTYTETNPNHVVKCASLGASSFTDYTLSSLRAAGWKTYNNSGSGDYGRESKVWRVVQR